MKQGYAPFGSVAVKAKKQKKVIDDPGPGSYDISLPIINPIVQTIRKKNNNVIVKLGHLGTASFQNDEDRFKMKLLPNIGPGQCISNLIKILLKKIMNTDRNSKVRTEQLQLKK